MTLTIVYVAVDLTGNTRYGEKWLGVRAALQHDPAEYSTVEQLLAGAAEYFTVPRHQVREITEAEYLAVPAIDVPAPRPPVPAAWRREDAPLPPGPRAHQGALL